MEHRTPVAGLVNEKKDTSPIVTGEKEQGKDMWGCSCA